MRDFIDKNKKILIIVLIIILALMFIVPVITDNTFGKLFELLFFIIEKTFPSQYGKIVKEYGQLFWYGIKMTMSLSLIGTLIGFLIALVFGTILNQKINQNSKILVSVIIKSLQSIIKVYVTVIRGTPMMVQAMLFYYSVFEAGIRWSPFAAGLFTVSVNTTAYLTEVIRGAIQNIDKGQMEAARSLGLNNRQANLYVIFPQAIKNALPSIGNEVIINIKDTAVLSSILIMDVFNAAKTVQGKYFRYTEPMIIASIIYLILTYSSSKILRYIETKMNLPKKEITSSN